VETIYTIEEVGRHLRVPAEVIENEIKAGRLQAFDIAGHIRIGENALAEYKNLAAVKAGARAESKAEPPALQTDWLNLRPAENFVHQWPNKKVEEYRDVREGVANYNGRQYHVKLGWTVRKTGGEERRRWLVLVDRYPTVEFVKCSGEEGGTEFVASIVRDKKGKQIPALATVPPEYKDIPVEIYSDVVKGSGTSNGQAVVCPSSDFQTMVRHALIRTRFRDERAKKKR
jgi:hypothetical protein